MKNIDNIKVMKNIDTLNMLGLVLDMPLHIKEGIELGRKAVIPDNWKIRNVVITGLGGSAIGGDLLKGYLARKCSVPIIVNRSYHMPEFVGRNTLVFCISYSGGTEETLSAFKEAVTKKANIVVVTSGGKIKELAKEAGSTIVEVPGGFSPRAALGYLFMPLVLIMSRLKLAAVKETELAETLKVLKRLKNKYKPEVLTEKNPAKQLACELFGKAVIIYGIVDTTEVVANRWKCQLAENSKVFSFNGVIPEMNHNEIVGWDLLKNVLNKFAVVFLRDDKDEMKLKKRIEVTKAMISNKAKVVREVFSTGETSLARLFSLIFLGDFTSVYLSLLYNIDPTPIKAIDHLKRELAK